jgi:hypothetical protein
MQGKSGNKKAVWYWVAAACLLLALLIPWFLANEKESVLVKTNSGQKHIQSSSARLLQPGHKDTSAVISSVPVEKKLPAISAAKSNEINSLVDHNAIRLIIVQDKKEKEAFISQKIANNAVMPVDTGIRIVAILPEKKKLTVVHINELGDPIAETPNIARYSERHSFQLKLMNQEVYTNPLPSGSTGFNIFKPKNAPSN